MTNPRWNTLYKVAGAAAIAVAVFIPIQGVIFALWPPPETVPDWFTLFQKNKLIGLLDMDLLLIVDYTLLLLVFLAFWAALRQADQSLAAIALSFQFIGTATYFASTAAFEMLGLSNQYTAAATDTERTMLLAAGQAMYSTWQGTAFNISYLFGCTALLIMSVVMLRSNVFSKTTAYLGLVAGVLMTVPPTAGPVGMVISFLSLVPTIPWLILVANGFFRLSRIRE